MITRTIKIKEEYQGLVITKNLFAIGNVTLDTNTVLPEHYQNYIKLGFEEFFEVEETNAPDCKCNNTQKCKKHADADKWFETEKLTKKYKNVKNEPKPSKFQQRLAEMQILKDDNAGISGVRLTDEPAHGVKGVTFGDVTEANKDDEEDRGSGE